MYKYLQWEEVERARGREVLIVLEGEVGKVVVVSDNDHLDMISWEVEHFWSRWRG